MPVVDKQDSTIQLRQRTMVLFMAIGTALASVETVKGFTLLAIADFIIFSIAIYLKDKMLLETSRKLNQTNEISKHPFIFLGEEIKSDSGTNFNNPVNANEGLTPDERYITLASADFHIKRIIFTVILSGIHLFFLVKLFQRDLTMTSFAHLGSWFLCLATLWFFFRVWQRGQFLLVMLINWCGVALLINAPITLVAIVLPFYLVLSFQLLQVEREGFGIPSWSASWGHALKLCALWWLCLILLGSLAPGRLFHSLKKQYQNVNSAIQKRGQSSSLHAGPSQQARLSLQELSSFLAKEREAQSLRMEKASFQGLKQGESSQSQGKGQAQAQAQLAKQLQQLQQIENKAQELAARIEQESMSREQLSQELTQLSEAIEEVGNSTSSTADHLPENPAASSTENLEDFKSKIDQMSDELKEGKSDSVKSQPIGAKSEKIEKKNATDKWEHYKNLIFKIGVFILILILAKLFERRARSNENLLSGSMNAESFKRRWKNLLAQKLDARTLVVEAYQLLAEANQTYLVTDKPFCPPFVVYPEIPTGLYQKEWPTVANSFLKTFYGDRSLNRNELKIFANSANRLFSVYFTKSLDQAITRQNATTFSEEK